MKAWRRRTVQAGGSAGALHPAARRIAAVLTFCTALWLDTVPGAPTSDGVCRPLAKVELERVRDVPGECVVLKRGTVVPRVPLNPPLTDDFTVRVWVYPEVLPSYGPGGFSDDGPVTIVRLGGSEQKSDFVPTGVFRIRRHFLEFAWLTPAGWKSVLGRTWIPLKRWAWAAVIRRGDVMELFLDGYPDGRCGGARAASVYAWCEVGRTGSRRRFVGRMCDLRIEPRAMDAGTLRHMVENTPGYTPLRIPQVDGRWLRAGILFTQPDGFPYYRAVRVGPDVLHPLAEGCGILFCLIPTKDRSAPDLLIGADARLFGARLALYRADGRDPGTAWSRKGRPVYDSGKTLELGERTVGLNGDHFVVWDADAAGASFIGRREGRLFLWRNRGSRENPKYSIVGPVLFGGKPLPEAMPPEVHCYEWRPGDVDGDGIPDMLVTGWWGDPRDDWPYRERRLGARNPHVGPGRGYDITGRWLGACRNALLFWARGLVRPGADLPAFGPVRPVYYGERPADRQVDWRVPYGIMSPALLAMNGRRWVLLFGDVERVPALPVRVDAGGEARCGRAVNFLADDARLRSTYFQNQMAVVDIDADGGPEVLIGGNPGRIVVLDGDRPGAFREAGSLSVRGGWVATDTLSVPCYVDWDGDGRRDLLVGDASGLLSFWPGADDPTLFGRPVWLRAGGRLIRHRAGYSGSLQGPGEAGWGYLQPTVADWDMDGDPDVIANDITARMVLYERAGSPWNLQPARPFRFQGEPLPAAWRSRPAVIPPAYGFRGLDRPCLLYLDDESLLCAGIPERTGGTDIARTVRLTDRDGKPVRLSGWGAVSGRTKLSIADWDGDGDWDVLFGTNAGCHASFLDDPPPCSTPLWLENVGSSREPVFARPRVIRLKTGEFINLRVHDCSPWAADVDGDGRLDLLTGAEDGKVYVFFRRELRWE